MSHRSATSRDVDVVALRHKMFIRSHGVSDFLSITPLMLFFAASS